MNCPKCDDAQKEIEKWKQQQKDDYATYVEACSERDRQIVELKAKIESFKKILKVAQNALLMEDIGMNPKKIAEKRP